MRFTTLARMLLLPVAWRREPLKLWCRCGRLVWDVPARRFLSSFEARTVCLGCGLDYSRVPTLAWLVRFYWKRLLKRRRFYGLWGMWRVDYPVYFWRFRGKAPVPGPVRIIPPVSTSESMAGMPSWTSAPSWDGKLTTE